MVWSLFDEKGHELKAMRFSNGKTQEDVVNEVVSEIKKGTKIVFIHGTCGSGKCLSGDTRVFCKPLDSKCFSYHLISSLVGKKGEIISLDERGKLMETSFKNVINSGKKQLYLVKTRTGRQIKASENHPFLTITQNGLEWLPLNKLNEKSYICLSNHLDLQKYQDLDTNTIKILAHLIAEGKLGDKVGSPKYYQNSVIDSEVKEDYISALKGFFPDCQIRNKHQYEVTCVFNNMNTTHGTTNKLRLLVRKFGLDGKRSKDKFVPEIIFNASNENVALFLKTLFSGDGTIYLKKSKTRERPQVIVEYISISRRLIDDISLLLSRFGIQHTITSKKFRDNPEYSFTIHISSQRQVMEFIDKIGFIGRKQKLALSLYPNLILHKFSNIDKVPRIIREYLKDKGFSYNQLNRFLNYEEFEKIKGRINLKKAIKDKIIKCPSLFNQLKIDFLREHIKKINEHIHNEMLSFICQEDIFWDKIDSVNLLGEDETYDLEVPEYHNFLANGIIVHNSAMALNIAKEIGRASIVVPIKNLQRQYQQDYMNKKYVLKNDGKKLSISMITGRRNHICPYLEENKRDILATRLKEKNSSIYNIFQDFKSQNNNPEKDISCDNFFIPCKIEIKNKNIPTLKKYYSENPERKTSSDSEMDLKTMKRFAVAPACPYWLPVLNAEMNVKLECEKKKYKSVSGEHIIYLRKSGCPYYSQFLAYADADVILFNSDSYLLETAIGRKPLTDVEIIDECDEFLDNFALEGTINISRLRNELNGIITSEDSSKKLVEALGDDVAEILDESQQFLDKQDNVTEINKTKVADLLKALVKSDVFEVMSDESYLEHCVEVAKKFYDILDFTYINFSKDKKIENKSDIYVKFVTINLDKLLQELIDKNKCFVFMSGTLHSQKVLQEVFGLKNFKVIEAETFNQGTITNLKTGLENDFKFDNFQNGNVSRQEYLKALNKCVAVSKIPTIVQVSAFQDLPTIDEKERFNLKELISSTELMEQQQNDREGQIIKDFKAGKMPILFTTRCNRGIDFPFETCNSVVITKFPYPNTQSLFWKILKKNKPHIFWDFYKDKAHRELLQRIYRSVRAADDHVYLLSPDIRVLESKVIEGRK